MTSASPSSDPPPRYGDYPVLFWDLDPSEPIDVEHPAVLGRMLESGSLEMIRALVPFEVIRRNVDAVEAPEHVREFWKLVVQHRDASPADTPRDPTARTPG